MLFPTCGENASRPALRHLRDPEKALHLWVDVICINQASVEEKNHQVAMMGEIYRCAEKCFMWLGEEEDESGLAIDLIKRLSTWLAQHPVSADSTFERHMQDDRAFDPAWQEVLNDPTSRPHFMALKKLLRREYWSRVWIIQEILLSQDAIMYCGFHHASWKGLQLLLRKLPKFGFMLRCSRTSSGELKMTSGVNKDVGAGCGTGRSGSDSNVDPTIGRDNIQTSRLAFNKSQATRNGAIGSRLRGSQPVW
jgi:hypothetical protein